MVVSTRCLADIDRDHDVDGSDLVTLASDFNRTDCSETTPCEGDINGDGAVNADDLTLFATEFGRTDCPHDELYYFHNDHLGTPQRITNQTGTIVWSANYKPFGEAIITTNTITNPFRFPGQYYDQETGLHYNYFRYYDPGVGRYLRGDPISNLKVGIMGFNIDSNVTKIVLCIHTLPFHLIHSGTIGMPIPYNYVSNNPENLTDPFGLVELKKGADESSGPFAFYGAGASLILTGTLLVEQGLGMIAVGGPVGLAGGSIVTSVGMVIWFTGVGTVYIGITTDQAFQRTDKSKICESNDANTPSFWGAGINLGY